MKILIALAAAATAVPALAQQAPTAPAPVSPVAADTIDPARLAVAHQTADYVWPLGTYARMMTAAMSDQMMQSMFDMKIGDVVPAGATGGKGADPKMANETLREVAMKADPYFQDRLSIMMHVVASELAPIMTKVEPDLREGLAHAFARKFTVEQLNEMNRFFATPAGRAYASESMLMMTDPDVIKAMAKAMPAMMQAMPQIMTKVEAATKQLPPPPGAHHAAASKH